jgi:hypothetical protein
VDVTQSTCGIPLLDSQIDISAPGRIGHVVPTTGPGTPRQAALIPVSGSPTISNDGSESWSPTDCTSGSLTSPDGTQEQVSNHFAVQFEGRIRMYVDNAGTLHLFGRRSEQPSCPALRT